MRGRRRFCLLGEAGRCGRVARTAGRPSLRSISAICADKAGWVTPASAAALPKCSVSASASKIFELSNGQADHKFILSKET